MLKESLAFACFGFIASVFLGYYDRRRISFPRLALLLFSGWIYWEIKYNAMIILVISMITILAAGRFHSKLMGWKSFSLTTGIFLLLSVLGSFIHPNFHLDRVLGVLQENHQFMIRISDSRNLIPFIPDQQPVSGFLLNLPISLFGGLFMPLPFQGKSLIALIPGFLNLIVLLLTLAMFFRKIKFPEGRDRILVHGIILYIITLTVMLAYSSPNFGTLERYKISYLPLFLSVVLSVNRFRMFRAGKLSGSK